MNGPFNIGDRIVLISENSYSGVIIDSNYNDFGTYRVKWNIDMKSLSTWVYSNDISLDKQIIREEKLNKLGI